MYRLPPTMYTFPRIKMTASEVLSHTMAPPAICTCVLIAIDVDVDINYLSTPIPYDVAMNALHAIVHLIN
jgi:hypothetical protein